jgi:oligosaccharide 4-alpha-D-glucosyltransferase
LFFDNPSKGYLDIGKESKDILEYGASSGELNVYIIFGDYQTILQSYHKLTGTQPLRHDGH